MHKRTLNKRIRCDRCNKLFPRDKLHRRKTPEVNYVTVYVCDDDVKEYDKGVDDYLGRLKNFNERWETATAEERKLMLEGKVRFK